MKEQQQLKTTRNTRTTNTTRTKRTKRINKNNKNKQEHQEQLEQQEQHILVVELITTAKKLLGLSVICLTMTTQKEWIFENSRFL